MRNWIRQLWTDLTHFWNGLFGAEAGTLRRPWRYRPLLECLEGRTVPAQYLWTNQNGAGDGHFSTAANWTELLGGPSAVPGSGDYVYFGSLGLGGSDTSCTFDMATRTVDRIIMDSSYTHTFSIAAGKTLTTTNYFTQYGSLSVLGTLDIGDYVNANGTIFTSTAGVSGVISASGDFTLNSGATITVSGTLSSAPSLSISSANFQDAGTISVGNSSTTLGGELVITGAFTEQSAGTTTVYHGSHLTFLSNGNAANFPVIEGGLTMGTGTATTTGGAVVATDTNLAISGGTLSASGVSGNSIIGVSGSGGDLSIYNSGEVDVGASSVLIIAIGDVTVGAQAANLSATGGTLNLPTGSMLYLPVFGSTTTFVVKSGGGNNGVVNMSDATIKIAPSRASVDLEGGTLNSLASGDTIGGNLLNHGTVSFGGSLHTLAISVNTDTSTGGNYTQGSDGELSMRLNNGGVNDTVTVAATATLDGTLSLTGLNTITSLQQWFVMTYNTVSGDFATVNFPDSNPLWTSAPQAARYRVGNP